MCVATGALAPADIGVLEGVQDTRVKYGYGLEHRREDVLLIALEDCEHLGKSAKLLVEDVGLVDGYVVDCQHDEHVPLSELGLAADINSHYLGHRFAVIFVGE